MTPSVATATHILAFLTIAADAAIAYCFAALAFPRLRGPLFFAVAHHGRGLAFLVAASGIAGSLFYSEIAGFAPCVLCMFQRIMLYPQAAFLALGLRYRRKAFYDAALVLAALGAIVAGYNQYLQFGGGGILPCGASGAACAQRFFVEFGYVTIPMMALTAFLATIALLLMRNIPKAGG